MHSFYSMIFSFLSCLALPCPALLCLALPCLALPCYALPCHALSALQSFTAPLCLTHCTSRPLLSSPGLNPPLLSYPPLQHLLGNVKLPLLTVLEHCLIDAVCEVGVDLSLAVQNDHLATMLAFVGGLGKLWTKDYRLWTIQYGL